MPEIEQPAFDELAVGELADVEEAGETYITDQTAKAISCLATTPGIYWLTLKGMGIPAKDATAMTTHWMGICAWGDEDDE